VPPATAEKAYRWVMPSYSSCCKLCEVGHGCLQQLLWRYTSGSCLATAVAAGYMRWVMGTYSSCCGWVMPTYSSCCGLYGVGHGCLQQLLQRYISGSCLATAVAAEVYKWVMGTHSSCCGWVMGTYSSCCGLCEVGHGYLQQLL
jgi:hypothetical protein